VELSWVVPECLHPWMTLQTALRTQEAVLTAPTDGSKADEDAAETNAGLMCGAETGSGR